MKKAILRSKIILFFLFLTLLTSSCATIMGKRTRNVKMDSYPSGADVYVNGVRMGSTPTNIRLNNRTNQIVEFKKEGYKPLGKTVNTKVGVGWVLLDIISGVWPIIIDAATGSWKRIDDKKINVSLDKSSN